MLKGTPSLGDSRKSFLCSDTFSKNVIGPFGEKITIQSQASEEAENEDEVKHTHASPVLSAKMVRTVWSSAGVGPLSSCFANSDSNLPRVMIRVWKISIVHSLIKKYLMNTY
jgi:hypothetical protein